MPQLKISASQIICLALALTGLILAGFSGRSHLGILILISIGVFMPFYSLAYTGCFTYLPKVKKIETPIEKAKQAVQHDKPRVKANNTPKEYDLCDIPYPPKRKGDRPRSSLPYGNGLSPEKKATKATAPRCALLAPKPALENVNPNPVRPVGVTLPLFTNAEPLATHETEDVFVQQDSIFL